MKKLIVILSVLALLAFAAVPTFADNNAGPCGDETVEASGSNYAAHHIVPLATNGDLGAVDHDGDSAAHEPGGHQGFSKCLGVH
jgi:hypothetical protein